MILGCIADDFTGATDLANTLVHHLAGKHSAMLLANHGPVVAGKTLEAALYATEELEETARLYLLLHGRNPRCLTPEQVRALQK